MRHCLFVTMSTLGEEVRNQGLHGDHPGQHLREVEVGAADGDRLEDGVGGVELRGVLGLSDEGDFSLLRLHLAPVQQGRAARDHDAVRLLLVLAETGHTLETLQEVVYTLNHLEHECQVPYGD